MPDWKEEGWGILTTNIVEDRRESLYGPLACEYQAAVFAARAGVQGS